MILHQILSSESPHQTLTTKPSSDPHLNAFHMPPPSNISTSHIIQLMKWHVPDAVRVDKFFKQVPLSGWDFDGFCAFHQADSKNTVLQQRKDLQDALDGAIAAGTKAFETLGLVTAEEHQRQQQEQQQMQTKDQLEEQLARTLNELVETQQQLWQVQVGLIREQEGHLETQGRLQQIQKDIIQMQETYITIAGLIRGANASNDPDSRINQVEV
ncbi:hypothetical protein BGX23_006718 [Mortierella sp. AD031]|nr:hypothetical protein BGX23_006718 [Mortierella sp. AD031]